MGCKIYYKGIKRGSKYIRKELGGREVERGNIVRIRGQNDERGRKIL